MTQIDPNWSMDADYTCFDTWWPRDCQKEDFYFTANFNCSRLGKNCLCRIRWWGILNIE